MAMDNLTNDDDGYSPCSWPVDFTCIPHDLAVDDDVISDCVDTAIRILWGLTGHRYGVCEEVTPISVDSVVCEPTLSGGRWRNIDVSQSGGIIALGAPIYSVDRVLDDDGGELNFEPVSYGVRVPPSARIVHWRRGVPVPDGGGRAVGQLAAELSLACAGDKRCRLPKNVQQISRQGVTANFGNHVDFLDRGVTGLADVDLWIRAVNPHGLVADSEVFG